MRRTGLAGDAGRTARVRPPAAHTCRLVKILLIILTSLPLVGQVSTAFAAAWAELASGLELGFFSAPQSSAPQDSAITILRFDPEQWRLRFLCAAEFEDPENRSAREWCAAHGLSAATNAGMFATDYRTHVGFLRNEGRIHNDNINDYQSVVAFSPQSAGLPRAHIFDLDEHPMSRILTDYHSVAQNLRLIKRPGVNRWQPQSRKWSEAALGQDNYGRLLFIFVRPAYSMHELNEILLGLPIGLVCAQHLEGGPEAQLYVRVGDIEYELVGSFETGFNPSYANSKAWPVPNVIGIQEGGPADR